MLHRVGTSLGESGRVATALGHFRRLVEAITARLGPDHPDTLAARHHASR
ncbi:tetratricopeptide repeat protein [Streptomyces sp. NPDC018347]